MSDTVTEKKEGEGLIARRWQDLLDAEGCEQARSLGWLRGVEPASTRRVLFHLRKVFMDENGQSCLMDAEALTLVLFHFRPSSLSPSGGSVVVHVPSPSSMANSSTALEEEEEGLANPLDVAFTLYLARVLCNTKYFRSAGIQIDEKVCRGGQLSPGMAAENDSGHSAGGAGSGLHSWSSAFSFYRTTCTAVLAGFSPRLIDVTDTGGYGGQWTRSNLRERAAKTGDLELLYFLHEEEFLHVDGFDPAVARHLSQNGQTDVGARLVRFIERYLVKFTAHDSDVDNESDPVDFAASCGATKVIGELFAKYGLAMTNTSLADRIPLEAAARGGVPALVETILEGIHKNKKGSPPSSGMPDLPVVLRSALKGAASNGHLSIVRLLDAEGDVVTNKMRSAKRFLEAMRKWWSIFCGNLRSTGQRKITVFR